MKIMNTEIKNVVITPCNGFTKAEALSVETLGFDCVTLKGSNATQAWKNAGQPMYGTKEFELFVHNRLKEFTGLKEGIGGYIIVKPGKADSRENPWKIINIPNKLGARKYKTVYQVIEAEFKTKTVDKVVKNAEGEILTNEDGEQVIKKVEEFYKLVETGLVVGEADTQKEADDLMREFIRATKKNYIVMNVKKCITPNDIVSVGKYSPSSNAEVGNFVAFGVKA